MADVADLDRTKNTEMFDNDYVTPASICKIVSSGFGPRQKRPFIDRL